MTHFGGKRILITGATDGIGLALARHLAAQGARLVLVGRRSEAELADPLFSDLQYCRADLSRPEATAEIAEWLAAHGVVELDEVILNAGLGYVGELSSQSDRAMGEMWAVNLESPIALTHRLYPLVQAGGGRFVYITSVAAALPVADYALYGATKAGLDGFVRSFQIEQRALARPVAALLVRLGATQTGMHEKSGATTARMDWTRFPSADATAAQILVQMAGAGDRSVERTIGPANRLVYGIGRRLPALAERLAGMTKAPPEDPGKILHMGPQIPDAEPRTQDPDTGLEATDDPVQHEPIAARHCVITGAAGGIGKALAQRFGAAGYVITGIDLDREQAMRTQAELINGGIRARFIIADLSLEQHRESIVERLDERPPVDVMIHCAGISAVGYFHALEWESMPRVLQVNLVAPVFLSQRLLVRRRARPGASLVYIASLSHFTDYPGAAVYAATKAGLSAFAATLAVALKKARLHVLTVYPGPVRTEHARRYSPDNRRESRRMAPEKLADAVFDAVQKRRRFLLPGVGARVAAWVGRWLPRVAHFAMRKSILDKLPKPE